MARQRRKATFLEKLALYKGEAISSVEEERTERDVSSTEDMCIDGDEPANYYHQEHELPVSGHQTRRSLPQKRLQPAKKPRRVRPELVRDIPRSKNIFSTQQQPVSPQQQTLEEQDPTPEEQEETPEEQEETLEERDQALEEHDQTLEEQEEILEEQYPTLEEQNQPFGERDQALEERDQALEKHDQTLGEQEEPLEEQEPTLKEREPTTEDTKQWMAAMDKLLKPQPEASIDPNRSRCEVELNEDLPMEQLPQETTHEQQWASSLPLDDQQRDSSLPPDEQQLTSFRPLYEQQLASFWPPDEQQLASFRPLDQQQWASTVTVDEQQWDSSLTVDEQQWDGSLTLDQQQRASFWPPDEQQRDSFWPPDEHQPLTPTSQAVLQLPRAYNNSDLDEAPTQPSTSRVANTPPESPTQIPSSTAADAHSELFILDPFEWACTAQEKAAAAAQELYTSLPQGLKDSYDPKFYEPSTDREMGLPRC